MTDDKPLTGADFPPLREGLIDGAGLAALFADLTCCTEVLEALEKGAPTARAASGTRGLGALLTGLLEGTVRAAQVRYRFQGQLWSDTILRTPAAFRVVRCLLTGPPGPGGSQGRDAQYSIAAVRARR